MTSFFCVRLRVKYNIDTFQCQQYLLISKFSAEDNNKIVIKKQYLKILLDYFGRIIFANSPAQFHVLFAYMIITWLLLNIEVEVF